MIPQSHNDSQEPMSKRLRDYSELKVSRKMTLMVIWTCVLYIIGCLPRNIYIIVKYIESSKRHHLFSLITLLILLLSNGLPFFIYYLYNNIFRKILKEYLKAIFCFCSKSNESRQQSSSNENKRGVPMDIVQTWFFTVRIIIL